MRSLGLFSSPKLSDQVLYPYKITGIWLCIFLVLPYQIGNGKLDSLENGFKHSGIYSALLLCACCSDILLSYRRGVPREDHIYVVVKYF